MKILGISGSPRKASQSGVYKLVQTVLANSGVDYELVSLRGKDHFRLHRLFGLRQGQCLQGGR
jgi:multimeric flavodoxin WrbA